MIDVSKCNTLEIYFLFFYNLIVNKINTDLIMGVSYITIHFMYVLLLLLVVLINTNILHLFTILIIITINVMLVLFCRTCPLMLLEQKYLNTNALKTLLKLINYTKKHKNTKNTKTKHLSKYLSITLDECTLESLLLLSLIYIIKMMILMIYL